MKVALICCAKQEEHYINEWLEHNYNIGIAHIYLCDNNDSDYNVINFIYFIKNYYLIFIIVFFILNSIFYVLSYKENKFLYLNNDCYELKYNDNQLFIISNKKIL